MGNLPSWGVSIAAVAVALAPGLLALSTGIIGSLLCGALPPRPKVLQPDAEQLGEQTITISAWRR